METIQDAVRIASGNANCDEMMNQVTGSEDQRASDCMKVLIAKDVCHFWLFSIV